MKDDKYYITMGQILIEKTKQAHPEKSRRLDMIAKNEFALAEMAKRYEENVKHSDDLELLFQLENIVIEVRGRLGLDD
jgi:hypothetical protein